MAKALKREDVAALVVIADPNARMSHGLNVDHMNLKWILREGHNHHSPNQQSSSTHTSIERQRELQQPPHRMDPLRVIATATTNDTSSSPPRKELSDALPGVPVHPLPSENDGNNPAQPHDADEEIDAPRPQETSHLPLNHVDAHRSVGRSDSSATSTERCRRRGLKNLATLDVTQTCPPVTSSGGAVTLLDSPRSVLLVLRNGHRVDALCKADQQQYYNEALRTGVPLDMVQLRIAAENKRRLHRYHALREEYDALSRTLSSAELVEAIRDYKFGVDAEAAKNRQRMAKMPRYAYYGGEDLGLFDADCQRVLEHTRQRTVSEIRRVLEQNEKKARQAAEHERQIRQDNSGFEAERRAAELKERDRRERSQAIQRRADEFRQRIQRIRQEHEEEQDDLRHRVEVKEQENEDFREHQESLRRHLSMSTVQAQELKRHMKKHNVQMRDEARRKELLEKADYMSKLHQRDMERRREAKAHAAKLQKEVLEERARTIRQLATIQQDEKRSKCEEAIERSNERAEAFKKTRALRLAARKQRQEERTERGAEARHQAEIKRAQLAQELGEEYNRKQQYIAEMTEEHEKQLTLQKELSKQGRIAQLDEQRRCQSVNAFRAIGYVADTTAKAGWLERENEKRELLAQQVRQERDALYRARDIILKQVEEAQIQRKKNETFQQLNATQ